MQLQPTFLIPQNIPMGWLCKKINNFMKNIIFLIALTLCSGLAGNNLFGQSLVETKSGYTDDERIMIEKCTESVHRGSSFYNGATSCYIHSPFKVQDFCELGQKLVSFTMPNNARVNEGPGEESMLNRLCVAWVDPVNQKVLVLLDSRMLRKMHSADAARRGGSAFTASKEQDEIIKLCEEKAFENYKDNALKHKFTVPEHTVPLLSWIIKGRISIDGFCELGEELVATRIGIPMDKMNREDRHLPAMKFSIALVNPKSNKCVFISAPWLIEKYEDK